MHIDSHYTDPAYLKDYKRNFTSFYDLFQSEFDSFSIEKTPKGDVYNGVIKAAFTKCFEFNYYNSRKKDVKEASFFLMGTLRSICEDLITLAYLKKLPEQEREELLLFNLNFEITKSLLVQESFFSKYNAGQIIVKAEEFVDSEYCAYVKNKPTNKKDAIEAGYKVYPSVFAMARETGYTDFYHFFYYVTSSLVHFRADTLLKMGWNHSKEDIKNDVFHYSVKNYSGFYAMCNLLYGSILFCEFAKQFKEELTLTESFLHDIDYFQDSLQLFDWPEIMTHDHMNVQQPSWLDRSTKRAEHIASELLEKSKRKK